ncbi:DsbA family protein [Acuticoccus sp.]|uniref:DsbA family protein n=1 Tax=Acuticoccus sp. TaxID=1904378 RepID=UPI003B5222E8
MLTRRTFAATLVAFALPFAASAHAQGAAEPLPDVVLGEEDAPVTVIEYASMTCPHCATFHTGAFQELKSEYIDAGKVKFVLREFPFDPLAAAVSMLARCSGDRYYDVVDLFFETQAQWAVRDDPLPKIRDLAKQAGFTSEAFEACLTDQALLDGINAVKDHGYNELGVSATPTIFVDGEELEGPRTIGSLREAIDPKLGS